MPKSSHPRVKQRKPDRQLPIVRPHEGTSGRTGVVERGNRQCADAEDQEETSGRSDA